MKLKRLIVLASVLFLVLFDAFSTRFLDDKNLGIPLPASIPKFTNYEIKLFAPLNSAIFYSHQENPESYISNLIITNTSPTYPLYVKWIDSYSNIGNLQSHLIRQAIMVKPYSTKTFLLDPKININETSSGFIIEMGSNAPLLVDDHYIVKVISSTGHSTSSLKENAVLINDTDYLNFLIE